MATQGNAQVNQSWLREWALLWWSMRRWWTFVGLLTLIGFVLWYWPFTVGDWIERVVPEVPRGKWHNLLAVYTWGMVTGHLLTHTVSVGLDFLFGHEEDRRARNYYPPAIVGFIEAIFYPTAFLTKHPEFIAAWLALKVAGGWNLWSDREGRERFHEFLVGNALSIFVGVIVSSIVMIFFFHTGQP